jgi:hypothetical protein
LKTGSRSVVTAAPAQQQILDALGALLLQRARSEVPRQRGELLGEWADLQLVAGARVATFTLTSRPDMTAADFGVRR